MFLAVLTIFTFHTGRSSSSSASTSVTLPPLVRASARAVAFCLEIVVGAGLVSVEDWAGSGDETRGAAAVGAAGLVTVTVAGGVAFAVPPSEPLHPAKQIPASATSTAKGRFVGSMETSIEGGADLERLAALAAAPRVFASLSGRISVA